MALQAIWQSCVLQGVAEHLKGCRIEQVVAAGMFQLRWLRHPVGGNRDAYFGGAAQAVRQCLRRKTSEAARGYGETDPVLPQAIGIQRCLIGC